MTEAEMDKMIKPVRSAYTNSIQKVIDGLTEKEIVEMNEKAIAYDVAEEKRHCYEIFKKCGVSERYLNCSFDSFEVTNELEESMKITAQKFCDDVKAGKQRSLIMFGNFGAGKTHIATAILREMISSVKDVVYDSKIHYSGNYTTINDFVNQLQMAGYDRKLKDRLIKNATSSDVCVFDEMGRLANNRMNEPDVIFQLVDSVYRNKKSLVLITNMNLNEIQNTVGQASLSRMRENNGLMIFDCTEIKDHRKC